jgi:hypothetical protein
VISANTVQTIKAEMDIELAEFQHPAEQFGTRHDPVAPVGG